MLDLILRHCNLPDGRTDIDIGIAAGRIAAVEPALAARAAEELDAAGQLVTPPFVDAHFHMDATLSYGLPRVNQSGTLLEGIALWGELKPTLTQQALVERALAYCDWAVARGMLAIRSHVDVCDPRLLAVEALLHVRERVRPYLDLQLVAFPQDGVLRAPGALDNLKRALDMGVDVVGGIPHFERTMRRAPNRSGCCASWRRTAACVSTCIATRATTRCRAISRRWPARPCGSACRAGWRART